MGDEPLPKFRSGKTQVSAPIRTLQPTTSLRPRPRVDPIAPQPLSTLGWFVSCFAGYLRSKSLRS